ncbi:hypothetical protein [Streptomyces sp. NPDC005799]|uniref:hypothetical protein n=1 Tax=Streptomyces sp. NPDC005799 TaxID=3154678 RepID=UPI0033C037EB
MMTYRKQASVAKRLAVVAVSAAAALVGFSAVPAQAASYDLSTTGAAGRVTYVGNGDWSLHAHDTLTDGHCARYQVKDTDDTSWRWYGDMVCTSTDQYVTGARTSWSVRICRTGIGNCSAAVKL